MNKSSVGLNRHDAENVLKKLLSSKSQSKVIAIKGDWGVGKTHLVKTVLVKRKLPCFHASAFGVTSINDLKIQFWKDVSFLKNIQGASQYKPKKNNNLQKENMDYIGKLLDKLPHLGGASATLSLINNVAIDELIQNSLIFLDDIERMSSKLSIDEILGFIEKLSEELNCQVLVVYNENGLEKEAREKLDVYREKIIDFEIAFCPTPSENFHIIFDEIFDKEICEIVLKYLNRENIRTNNIRVLRKLKWALENISSVIQGFELGAKQIIIHEVLCIALARFDNNFSLRFSELQQLEVKQQRNIIREKTLNSTVRLFIWDGLERFSVKRLSV